MRVIRLLVLAAVSLVCSAAPARAEFFYFDDFSTGINPSYWAAETSGTASVEWKDIGGYQFVKVSDNSSNGDAFAGLNFKAPLAGDFSASVTYSLSNWPSNNLERVGIGTEIGATERVSDDTSGGEVYLTDYRGDIHSLAASQNQGRLRFERADSVFTGYYYYDPTPTIEGDIYPWVTIFQNNLDAADSSALLNLSFGVWSNGGSQSVTVNFDDFNLHAYDMADPGVAPEPLSCALFMIGGGVLILRRRQK